MNTGLIGGIAGGIIGVAGGMIGTYFSIRNTKGPKERSFMVKVSVISWVVGIIFITLLLTLPSPYKWFMWLPYGILFPFGIIYINKRLRQIRQKETEQDATLEADSDTLHKRK
ncbi:hypothetical protein J7K93_12870 [bacterium]|nr:hypothetical protein [bacterium]